MKEQATLDFLSQLLKGTEYEKLVFGAGGLVRDKIMKQPIKDIDLVITAKDGGVNFAIWLAKKLNIHSSGNPVIFPRFGTAKLTMRNTKHNGIDLSGVDIECVMTRGEQYTPGSRKPEVVYADLKQDSLRRDLTVNSLYQNIVTGEVLDPTGMGIADIKAGIVRTPLNPDETFKDDPLRMLRAVRFATKYNWKMPLSMVKALRRNAGMLKTISAERIQDELNKMLMTKNPDKALKVLSFSGLMKHILPELDLCIGVGQNKFHSEDVFNHICTVVKNTKPELKARLGAVFHDIGKPETQTTDDTGVHFYTHEMVGAKIAQEAMERLRYSSDMIQSVVKLVDNHMRLKSAGPEGVQVSDKALRKFAAAMGTDLESAWNLMHADNISHAPDASMPNQIPNLQSRTGGLAAPVDKQKLPINGNDIMTKLGIKPGPMVKQLLAAVQDLWYEDPSLDPETAMRAVQSAYEKLQNKSAEEQDQDKASTDILHKKIRNPETENDILVKTALNYEKNHPARIAAEKLIKGS